MTEQELAQQLEQYSDEELATILEFVEQLGSLEAAQAAIDALSDLRKAA
jgi:predicted house-cleaning noncanonical NTP pyrophosphatase (MazG superfamily)